VRNNITKMLGIIVTIAMFAGFVITGSPVVAVGNPPSVNGWQSVAMPDLAPGTDVELIEQANDGTIFISTVKHLFKIDPAIDLGGYSDGIPTGNIEFNWFEESLDSNDKSYTFVTITDLEEHLTDLTGVFIFKLTADIKGSGTSAPSTESFSITGNLIADKDTKTVTFEAGGYFYSSDPVFQAAVENKNLKIAINGFTVQENGDISVTDIRITGSDGFNYDRAFDINAVSGVAVVKTIDENTAFEKRYSMYKSTDGYNWEPTNITNKTERITAIKPSANYANDKIVYVAVDNGDNPSNKSNYSGPTGIINKPEQIASASALANYSNSKTSDIAFYTGGTSPVEDGYAVVYRCIEGADSYSPYSAMGLLSTYVTGEVKSEHVISSHVYTLDSYYDGTYVWLLAATNLDVFKIKDDGNTAAWTDMQLSETLGSNYSDEFYGVNVFAAKFAPDYVQSGVIWAIYHDNYGSWRLHNRLGNGFQGGTRGYGIIAHNSKETLWATNITPMIIKDSRNSPLRATAFCDFEFASNYDSDNNPELYAALNFSRVSNHNSTSEQNGVWRIKGGLNDGTVIGSITHVTEDQRMGVGSIEVDGDTIIAGSYDDSIDISQVQISFDNGDNWQGAIRNPLGEGNYPCKVLIGKYGQTKGLVFAATGGLQSGISVSDDNGLHWTQTAFFDDTFILEIRDVSFNPTNSSAIMITYNEDYITNGSVWITDNINSESVSWQRIYCKDFNTDMIFTKTGFAADDSAVVFFDESTLKIWRSEDNCKTFDEIVDLREWNVAVSSWIIPDKDTFYVATWGGFWSTDLKDTLAAEGIGFTSIEMRGNVFIAGDTQGNAYVSTDKGFTWENLVQCDTPDYNVVVAFDAYNDNIFYYVTESGKVGKVTFDGNELLSNVALNDSNGDGVSLLYPNAIAVSADNTLYVAGINGMARLILDQDDNKWEGEITKLFEIEGLQYTASPNAVWTVKDYDKLYVFEDFLSSAPQDVSAIEIESSDNETQTKSIELSWKHIKEDGDTVYRIEWKKASAATWNSITKTVEAGTAFGSNVSIEIDGLSTLTEYMFRVRVADGSPVQSRWSENASLTTSVYVAVPVPISPSHNAVVDNLHPIFTWSVGVNAANYEFQLSKQASFSEIIDSVLISENIYVYQDDNIKYNSEYYWRVRAISSDGTTSKWSVCGPDDAPAAFRTGGALTQVTVFQTVTVTATVYIENQTYKTSTITVTPTIPSFLVTASPSTVVSTYTETVTEPVFTERPVYTVPTTDILVVTPNFQESTVTHITNIFTTKNSTTHYFWPLIIIGLVTITAILLVIRLRTED